MHNYTFNITLRTKKNGRQFEIIVFHSCSADNEHEARRRILEVYLEMKLQVVNIDLEKAIKI